MYILLKCLLSPLFRYSSSGADLFSSYGGFGSTLDGNSGSNAGGSNKKVLYAFFARCIDHWPLDASFRLVLETWLSYIQPWRYTNLTNSKGSANKNTESSDPVDSVLWASFVDENYRFYTNLFGKILSTRFFRVDLSSHKNSYMLFRVAKVYSQENLMNILSHVSSMHGRSIFQVINFYSQKIIIVIPSFHSSIKPHLCAV